MQPSSSPLRSQPRASFFNRRRVIIISIVAAVLIALALTADTIVSVYGKRQIDAALAQLDKPAISVGGLKVALFASTVFVQDISVKTDSLTVFVDGMRVHYNLKLRDLWRNHVSLRSLSVSVDTVSWQFPEPSTFVHVRKAYACVHDLSYGWKDSSFVYNDSVYAISVGSLSFDSPGKIFTVRARDIETENGGAIQLGRTRLKNGIGKRELADLMNCPTNWIDLSLESVRTSPLNLFKLAQAKRYDVDKVYVKVSDFTTYRDTRHPSPTPFPMPQQALLAAKIPVKINSVEADVKQLHVELTAYKENCSRLHLGPLHATVRNFYPVLGQTLSAKMTGKMGKGDLAASFAMHFNKDCDYDISLKGSHVDGSLLNDFIRPLVAMTCDCALDSLATTYSGNSVEAKGQFLLMYHDLNVTVHKEEDIPFKIISNNAGAIQSFAHTMIPTSNPAKHAKGPNAYEVYWKRKDTQPFQLVAFGPVINGVVKTMLPGLFIQSKLHEGKSEQAKPEKTKPEKTKPEKRPASPASSASRP